MSKFAGFYTGIGSRETPENICRLMKDVAAVAAARGYTGRSGGADGADNAFEEGFLAIAPHLSEENLAEFDVYVPWTRFNGRYGPKHRRHNIILPGANEWDAEQIMKTVHPIYAKGGKLTGGALALHTRNVYQVLVITSKCRQISWFAIQNRPAVALKAEQIQHGNWRFVMG